MKESNTSEDTSPFSCKQHPAAAIKRFQDLIAWQLGFRIAVKVYDVTKSFPIEERYTLTSQMRRSANSIPANIAEGFGRHTPRDYLRSLFYARGSIAETESHLEIAHAAILLKKEDFDALQRLCMEARKTIQGLTRHVRSTVNGFDNNKIAENEAEYFVTCFDSELSTFNSEL